MNTPSFSRRLARSLCTLAAAAAMAAGGCSYSTWPPVEEGERQNNPGQINSVPTPQVIGEALSLVTLRYPPVTNAERGKIYDAPFAFSLPAGADAESYDRVATRVREGGRGAQPATEQNAGLPTYIVSRVIVRGVTAEVDVLRPVAELGNDAQGRPHYQGVTVYLLGNIGTWKADRHHTFPIGIFDVPARTTRPSVNQTWGTLK
jgi:hypothetical protein